MGINSPRMKELMSRAGAPRFNLGSKVRHASGVGVVDTIYSDFTSVTDAFAQDDDWYDGLDDDLKLSKDGRWYSVITENGALLVGEEGLRKVAETADYGGEIERIRAILADDANYQTAALKLGGIWDICTRNADYMRRNAGEGREVVEIVPKKT